MLFYYDFGIRFCFFSQTPKKKKKKPAVHTSAKLVCKAAEQRLWFCRHLHWNLVFFSVSTVFSCMDCCITLIIMQAS